MSHHVDARWWRAVAAREGRLAFPLGVSLVVMALTFVGCQKQTQAAAPAPSVPVVVATAVQRDVPLTLNAIGNVQAMATVTVTPQIAGQITAVYFKEGQNVRKGQRLFSINPQPLQAELQRAEGNLARDSAQSANAVSKADRYKKLLDEGVVAHELYDELQAEARSSSASVAADRAAVQAARVQLQFTAINAPISGRTGSLLVYPGNVVEANKGALVTLNQISPIYVNFAIPEQQLVAVKKYAAAGSLKVDAMVTGEESKPVRGRMSFVDNSVDPATGTIKLKGTFDNAESRLWPGQFVNVVLTLTTQGNAIVVPTPAVQTGQQGQFVFVVKPDMTAETRPVVVTRTVGNESIIDKGLRAGEKVVTDGQIRIQPGIKLDVKQATPAAQIATPADHS